MKQKIFSLLVLMITTVCGAWAQDVESSRDYNVILSALYQGDSFEYDNFVYAGVMSPSEGCLYVSLEALQEAFKSQTHVTASSVSILGQVPAGISVVDDAENEGIKNLKIQLTTADLSSDVEFYLSMGSSEVDNIATPRLILSVSHPIHRNSSSELSVSQWQWSNNATHHWLECDEYGHCDYAGRYDTLDDDQWENIDEWAHRAAHSDSNLDYVCDACGYEMPAPAHVHSFSSDWIKTETKHFHPCTASADCPLASDHGLDIPMNNDDFSNAWEALSGDEKNAMAYSGHLDVDNDGICNICEYHMHLFSDWTADGDKHYKKCVVDGCTLTIENYRNMTVDGMVYEDHTYTNATNPCVCSKCGHLNHILAGALVEGTDDGHYLPCTVDGCPKNSVTLAASAFTAAEKSYFSFAAHHDDNSDGKCDDCPKVMNSMVDPQHSHSFEPVVYGHSDDYHWKVCQNEGCDINYAYIPYTTNGDTISMVSRGAHTYDAETQKCTVCELLNPNHTHVLQGLYYQDGADGHYANCKYPDCPLTLAWKKEHSSDGWYGAHVDGNNDGRCDACYYLMGHQHSPSNEWAKGETIHYHPCLNDICPFHLTNKTEADFAGDQLAAAALAEGVHRYGKSQDKATGSDVSGSGYYTCKDCSYVNTTRQSETHTHSYDGPWMATPDTQEGSNPIVKGKHWKECNSQVGPCNQVKDQEGDHVYDDTATDSKYYICSTCGYTSALRKNDSNRPHAHQISGAWTKTEDTDANTPGAHYHKCTATGCTLDYTNLSDADKTLTSYATHTYGTNKDGSKYYTCQVCGYVSDKRKNQTHTHSYGTTWEKDEKNHWHECTSADGICNAPRGDDNSHVYGTEGDARWTCQVCDYVNTARKKAIEAAADAATTMAWMWDYEIPFTFFANNILNDRRMKAGQCYTVCLPYALPINGMKVYYVEQSSESLVGFHEQTLTELPYLTPCVVLPSATSSPLSVAGGYVIKTDTIAKRDSVKMAAIGTNGKHNFMGSLSYIHGDKGTDKWILQAADADHPEGSFKKIQGTDGAFDNASNRACILPMRAYIGAAASSGSRMAVRIYSADNSTTVIDRLVIDEDGAPVIFDLQGRRVQNPRKGGLYIINGRKAVLK